MDLSSAVETAGVVWGFISANPALSTLLGGTVLTGLAGLIYGLVK